MKTLRIALAGLLAPVFAGLILSTTAGAADEKPDPAAFARGAKSWVDNCARCHNPRDPKDYRDEQWRVVISHMRIRAGLTGEEARDILKFLQASN